MRRSVIAATAAAAVVIGGGAAAYANARRTTDPAAEVEAERRFTDAHRADAAVSQVQAETIARRARPGRVVESHLQDEGALRWEVKTDDGVHVWEVQIDPQTGSVVGQQVDE